jgi:hypothetical protein
MDWHLHDFMTIFQRKITIDFVTLLEFFYSYILNLICSSIYWPNTNWSSGADSDAIKQPTYWATKDKEVNF